MRIIRKLKIAVLFGIFVLGFFVISSEASAADRYWVGGTGNWSDTTHWSDTDGGGSGFSVPTSTDNVYFSAGSFSVNGNTVTLDTIANTASLDFTGVDQTVTFSSSVNSINIFGALTLPAANLTWAFTGTAYTYLKTTTPVNITMGSTTGRGFNRLIFDGVGGTWTLQDEMSAAQIRINNGTLNTNDKTISSGELRRDGGTFTLNLTNSTYNANNGLLLGSTGSGLTVIPGNSNIYINGDWIEGAGKHYNNIYYNRSPSSPMGGTAGNFSCENFYINPLGEKTTLNISTNITINNNLTINGLNSTSGRIILHSSSIGTQRTITVNPANVIASNVDFRDIKFQNPVDLSGITGGSGDAGGNTGITFTVAQPQYFKHTSGAVSWSNSTKWFSDSSPRTTPGRVPLPQDDVYFDAGSFTGASTLTVDVPRIGRSLDMSGVNQAVGMPFSVTTETYGNFILGNNITPSTNGVIKYLMGRGSFLLNTYGKSIWSIYIYTPAGTYNNQSNIISGQGFAANLGTFYTNGYNINSQYILIAGTMYFGNSTITLTREAGDFLNVSGTIYAETSTIIINPASGSANIVFNNGSARVFNNVIISGTHSGTIDFKNSEIISNLTINPGRKVRFTAGTTQQIGKLTATGTALNPITISSVTGATHTLNYTGTGNVVGDYLNISYSNATPANKWYASNSTNSGNNSGWIFANAPDAPTGLTPTVGNAQVSLSWTAPADNGTVITDYIVDYKLTSDFTWSTFADGVSTLTTATIIGLTNSASYDFRVTAVNAIGPGIASAVSSATPYNPSDRYWVGGTGNWSDTTHWSNVNGGTGGQSVPTSTNDVYFSAGSFSVDGNIITIDATANTASLDFSGIDQTMTLTNLTNILNVYGSFILSNKLSTSFGSGWGGGSLYFKATTTGKVIKTNGSTLGWNRIYFDGAGGEWTNQDDWNFGSAVIFLDKGTWNTNDKNIKLNTSGDIGYSGTASNATLNLGSSTLTINSLRLGPNNVLSAGTSNIIITKSTYSYLQYTIALGKAFTFNNITVNFPSSYASVNNLDALDMQGSTINNLTYNGYSVAGSSLIMLSNFTVLNNLSLVGNNSTNYRLIVRSNALGTQRTITAANVVASNVDFRDIRGAGTGNWDLSNITGLSGDAGGNSGITFTTAQPQYFKHTSGAVSWSDSTKWFSDFSPRTTPGRVPLPQDDVYFDAGSFAGASTLIFNTPRVGRSLDMSNINQSVVFDKSINIESYGNFILSPLITGTTYYQQIYFLGRGSYSIKIYPSLRLSGILGIGGGYQMSGSVSQSDYKLLNDLTCSGGLTNSANFDLNGFNVKITGNRFFQYAGNLYLGSGIFELNMGNIAMSSFVINSGNVYAQTSTLKFNHTTGNYNVLFDPGSKIYNKVWISGSNTGYIDMTGSNTFNELIIDPGRNVRFTAGTTQQIGKLTAIGNLSNPITIGSITNATHTLNYTGTGNVVGDYLNISYSNATPANKWYASHSTNNGNNSGWTFANAPDAPTGVIASPGDSQVSLSWTAPVNNGGITITDYIIEYKISTDSVWTTFSDGISTVTTAVVTPLINGTSYDFQVSAVNPVGQSSTSGTTGTTPMTIPSAPTINSVTPDDGEVSVGFSAPISDGGSPITSYTVTSNPGGIIGTGVSSPILVSGLSNGTAYTFTMTATNNIGEGPASLPSNSVTPHTVPNAPTALSATFGNSLVSLSWLAPAFDGGSLITDYAIEYKISTDSVWSTFADGVSINTLTVVTGLTNGITYDFRVSAVNVAGQGDASGIANATPVTVPSTPTITSVVASNGQVTVYFDIPTSDGGSPITSYTVTSNPGNIIEVGVSSPIVVTGLTNGTTYTFTVTATNIAGTGASSQESDEATPATIPDTPTTLFATPGNTIVDLSWIAPLYNGGSTITDYVIEYKISTDSVWSTFADGISSNTFATVNGLSNGVSYDFRVSAVNVMGQGSPSVQTSDTPVTVPDAPTNISATASNAQATVSFTPPAFNGGSTINSYTVTSNPGGITNTGNASPITLTGLTNGTTYTFTVTATNAIGESPSSSLSNSVTPATVPDAPTGVVAVEGNGEATVSFTPPVFNGGSSIISYTATSNPGNFTSTSNSLPLVVAGLTNGTTYTFTVTAKNTVGDSLPSSPSNSVTLSVEPSEPVNLASTVLGSSIGLTWSAPVLNGGSAILDYVIEYKLTTGGVWSIFADGLNVNTNAIVTGLSNSTSYDFRVKAVNMIGEGPSSSVVSATPGEPAQVIIQNFSDLTVSDIGANIRITNEGSDDYEYQYTWCVTDSDTNLCGDGNDVFVSAAAKLIESGANWDTNLISTVLTPGNYYFHINVLYGSESSNAYQSFTAFATYPNTPTNISAIASNAQATVSFTPPAFNGGSTINSYTVTSNPGGITNTGNASPITLTGLTNGTTYTFTVTATNAIGEGPASSLSNAVTPATIPDAPTGVVAVAGDKKVSLSWVAPINNGGSPIIDYVVEYKLSSEFTWTIFADGISLSTVSIVTGLINNNSYDFRISAVNIYGQSIVNSTSALLPNQNSVSSGSSGSIIIINQPLTETGIEKVEEQDKITQPKIEVSKSVKTNVENKIIREITNPSKTDESKLEKNEVRAVPVEKTKTSLFPSSEVSPSPNSKVYKYIAIFTFGLIFIELIILLVKRFRRNNY